MSEDVQDMFGRIAHRYDRANNVLSFGLHHRWRRVAVRMAGVGAGDDVLDLACGTGDLSLALAKRVGGGHVIGTDFVDAMLEVARNKAARRGRDVAFQWADALDLPFETGSFDAATIAFGIRNVDDAARAVQEMHRVVRSGGRVVVLEFGQPRGPFGALYRWYGRQVMPRVGGLITGERGAYEYLPRTAASFPAGEEFLALMEGATDFDGIRTRRLMQGVAWCYAGTVA